MENNGLKQKSTYEVWQRWAKVLKRQLDLTVDVYNEHKDTAGATRAKTLSDRIELFIDPVAHASELAKLNFDVKGSIVKLHLLSLTNLVGLFRDGLKLLPVLSDDMQRLLDSPCYGNCRGRVASDIFKGPHSTQNEGIAAGVPDERGGLPWVLSKLLDEAEMGGDDYFQRGLNSTDDESSGSDDSAGSGRSQPQQQRRKITVTGVQ